MPGIRDRLTVPTAQRKSLRFSLAPLVLVPTLALIILWGATATILTDKALALYAKADAAASMGAATSTLISHLQDERRTVIVQRAAESPSDNADVDEAQRRTNIAVRAFEDAYSDSQPVPSATAKQADELQRQLDALPRQRRETNAAETTQESAYQRYNDLIEQALRLLQTADQSGEGPLPDGNEGWIALLRLSESLSREDSLMAGATSSGQASYAFQRGLGQVLGDRERARTDPSISTLSSEDARAYRRIIESAAWAQLKGYEHKATAQPARLPEPAAWNESMDTVTGGLRKLNSRALEQTVRVTSGEADRLVFGAAIGSTVALAALAFVAIRGPRAGKSLSHRLDKLQRGIVETADTTLPDFAERLERGEPAEPGAMPPRHGDGDELDRLTEAAKALEWAARSTLVQQARRRAGAEQLFLGLARRMQVLVNRMIPKIDQLERTHHDSELLKDIFAVDHLATRMRRHTENLVILGGSPPTRRLSTAVPVYEVMRSAISEVEEYRRVEAQAAPHTALIGPAVADVVHLLAELVENGTTFSPPETTVSITATRVARGLAIEVEDRGLGMSDERYREANDLLAAPPKLDVLTLGNTPRLGLFVVARLAKRHNLEVSLRRSPYGGTLAILLLPNALLEEGKSVLEDIVPGKSPRAPETSAAEESPKPVPRSENPSSVTSPLAVPAPPVIVTASGFPSYRGAGLLPALDTQTEETTAVITDEPRPTAADSEPSAQPGAPVTPSSEERDSALPRRVRGANLAEPLRMGANAQPERRQSQEIRPPERAGAAIAAIQAANKRVRGAHPRKTSTTENDSGSDARDL